MLVVWILLGVIALLVILSIIAPNKYTVERAKIVNVPIETAFASLRSLKEMQNWSPWSKKDPEMSLTFFGEDGAIGSSTHWVGNKEVGEGKQQIKKIIPHTYIESELEFLKPWKTTSKGFFRLKEIDETTTEVAWGTNGRSPFPFNVMLLFMNMNKMLGEDFEQGMDDFKKYIEQKWKSGKPA